MQKDRGEPERHPDKKIWLTISIFLAIVALTCGWLAFYRPTLELDDHAKVQAAAMTQDDQKTIRLVAQEPNGFRVSYQHQGQAGKFYVVVRFGNRAPIKGRNHLSIIVLDSLRNKVDDATVKIEYLMPSLPGRPSMMHYEVSAQQEKGSYHADVNLSMKGEWIFRVDVWKNDQKGTFEFPAEVLR